MEHLINKIHCADCIEFMKQIPDNSIDLIITDPPYNILPKGKIMLNGSTDNFDWDNIDLIPFTEKWFNIIISKMKNNTFCYIFWSQKYFNAGINIFKPDRVVIWKSDNLNTYVKGDFIYDYLPIFVIKKGNPKLIDGKHSGVFNYTKPQSNFKINKLLHPTQKPINLILKLIEISSSKNDIVLDPFLGSGTTAVACKMLNRRFIGIEKDEKYCEIARKRLNAVPKRLDKFNLK